MLLDEPPRRYGDRGQNPLIPKHNNSRYFANGMRVSPLMSGFGG